MPRRSESILLLDHTPRTRSICVETLESLGYHRLHFAAYSHRDSVLSVGDTVDAVVAAWTDTSIDLALFQHVVGIGVGLPRARGAMIVSPFSTGENASVLRRRGARSWVRFPFTMDEFDRHLRVLLDGDRRTKFQTVAHDRRREPVYLTHALA